MRDATNWREHLRALPRARDHDLNDGWYFYNSSASTLPKIVSNISAAVHTLSKHSFYQYQTNVPCISTIREDTFGIEHPTAGECCIYMLEQMGPRMLEDGMGRILLELLAFLRKATNLSSDASNTASVQHIPLR